VVEAAGVEPDISIENTQLTDSGYASFAGNAMISKSTVQSLYSHCTVIASNSQNPNLQIFYCK